MEKAKHRNGIRHPIFIKHRAEKLRREGRTHREIVRELGISLGSAGLWTKSIKPTPIQRQAILKRASKAAFTFERRRKLSISAKINLAKYREKYTREDLLNRIKNFYKIYGRIPLKREFNMYDEYKRKFGSWNSAIRLAGFSPNPILFAYKFKADDGHICDSFTEKIIDDWLHKQKITHERSYKYGNTKMTADFFIPPNRIIEFFGLAGVQKAYDKLIEIKRKFCRKSSLKLIEIYPEDIFPTNRLHDIIKLS